MCNNIRLVNKKWLNALFFIFCFATSAIAVAQEQSELTACNTLNEGMTVIGLGSTAEVCFLLDGFDSKSERYDVYLAVKPPQYEHLWFITSTGQLFDRNENGFSEYVKPYLANTPLSNEKGTLFEYPIPITVDMVGEYKFYAVVVRSGEDVADPDNWVGKLTQTSVFVTRL